MISLDNLTEQMVIPYFTQNAWKKGVAMQAQVYDPVRAGATLRAHVLGDAMYTVEVTALEDGITGACNCPSGGPGLCKHAAALLVRWFRAPKTFKVDAAPPRDEAKAPPLAVRPAPERTHKYTPPAWIEQPPSVDAFVQDANLGLRRQLEELTVAMLRAIASEQGWSLRGTMKSAIIEQIAQYMSDPQVIVGSLAKLSARDCEVLAVVAAAGHAIPQQASERFAEILKIYGRAFKRGNVMDALGRLGQAGLLITSHMITNAAADMSLVPSALWPHLPALLEALIPGEEKPPPAKPGSSTRYSQPRRIIDAALQMLLTIDVQSPTRAPRTPRPVLEDKFTWLRGWEYDPDELARFAHDGKLYRDPSLMLTTPPPPRALTAEHLQRFAPLLGNEWAADFLFTLLEGAGLVKPGAPPTVAESAKLSFLRLPPDVQLAILFDAYLGLRDWQEMWELMRGAAPHLQLMRIARADQYGMAGTAGDYMLGQLVGMRRLFLHVLAWLPEDRWLPIEPVMALLAQILPTLESTGGYMYHAAPGHNWHFAWNRRRLGRQPDDWSLLQGAALGVMLLGPLSWFGLVDLQTTETSVTHLRLHGLAHLLRRTLPGIDVDRPMPSAVDAAVIARVATPPTFKGERLHLTTLTGAAAMFLEKIARPISTALNNAIYELDVTRVHHSFEGGATVETLAEEWTRCFGAELPAALRAHLAGWWQGYGVVRLYRNLTLIEFGDDYALREMRAVTPLDAALLVELSPRAVLIPADAVERLMAALQKAGYTPKSTDGVE
jgi:hypothetical protein